MTCAAALTLITAKLWIKRIARSRVSSGIGRNSTSPASRWHVMGGGDCLRRSGNHNPQITQITQNRNQQESFSVLTSSYLCNLRNLRTLPSLRTRPQTQDHVFSDSHDQLSHCASSIHTRVQSATNAYTLSHSQT